MRRACAALLLVACAARAMVDDAGRDVTLAAPPRRIVTLAPSLTEIVYAVDAGPLLVAVDESSDFPRAALALPRVADYQRIDVERLVALKPDLVLVWGSGNTMRELAQIEAAGIALFRIELRRLDDIPRALERVGALLGHADTGRSRAQALRDELAALRAKYAATAPVRVFYQVWSRPLLTLNGDHLVSHVIRLCGGRNVFAALAPLVPEVSTEAVAAADPEVVFTARDGGGPARRSAGAPAFAMWQPLRSVTAVRRGWFYTLPGDTVARQGPRIGDGVRAVCGALDEVRRERAASR